MARIFRISDANGRPIITDFPDEPPMGSTDLVVRSKHITEVETFTFLGFILAHELAATDNMPHPVQALINSEVADPEFRVVLDKLKVASLTNEQLADELNDNGLNWEHFLANTNAMMIPGNPLRITDAVFQEKIDSLDIITEGLVREVNSRSSAMHK